MGHVFNVPKSRVFEHVENVLHEKITASVCDVSEQRHLRSSTVLMEMRSCAKVETATANLAQIGKFFWPRVPYPQSGLVIRRKSVIRKLPTDGKAELQMWPNYDCVPCRGILKNSDWSRLNSCEFSYEGAQ